MDATKTIDTQVTLPIELYQSIVRRAEVSGHSVSDEIVSLLNPVSLQIPTELDFPKETVLDREFADWEAASDEDWVTMDTLLASEEN